MNIEPKEEGDPDLKNVTGIQVAIPVEIALNEMFALQPEIMFGAQGARLEESEKATENGFLSESEIKATIQAQYLEVPVLGKFIFGSEAIKFHVLAGPSFGFGIGGKAKTEGFARLTEVATGKVILDEKFDNEESDVVFVKDGYDANDVKENETPFSKTSINLHLGAGVGVNVGRMTVFVDGRYILGLNDLTPEQKDTPDANKTTGKGRRIGISAGILFPIN